MLLVRPRAHNNLSVAMDAFTRHVTACTLVWLLCACARPVFSDVDKRCPSTDIQINNRGICGNQLSDILKLLCGRSGYHKRSVQEPGAMARPPGLFLSRSEAASYLRRSRRSEYSSSDSGYQGIVCECCTHSCTIMELSQYCINPTDNLAMALYHSPNIGKRNPSQLASQSASQLASQSASQSASQLASQSASQSANQPPAQPPANRLPDKNFKNTKLLHKLVGDTMKVSDM